MIFYGRRRRRGARSKEDAARLVYSSIPGAAVLGRAAALCSTGTLHLILQSRGFSWKILRDRADPLMEGVHS
jgi:hypothetical protein